MGLHGAVCSVEKLQVLHGAPCSVEMLLGELGWTGPTPESEMTTATECTVTTACGCFHRPTPLHCFSHHYHKMNGSETPKGEEGEDDEEDEDCDEEERERT